MNNLTLALAHEGKFSEAEPLARSTLEAYQHAMGPNHPSTLGAMDTLVYCLYLEHHYADAEKMAEISWTSSAACSGQTILLLPK